MAVSSLNIVYCKVILSQTIIVQRICLLRQRKLKIRILLTQTNNVYHCLCVFTVGHYLFLFSKKTLIFFSWKDRTTTKQCIKNSYLNHISIIVERSKGKIICPRFFPCKFKVERMSYLRVTSFLTKVLTMEVSYLLQLVFIF